MTKSFTFLSRPLLSGLVLAAGLAAAAPAATIDFVVDLDNSSVDVTRTGTDSRRCLRDTNCAVDASLAVTDGQVISVAPGSSQRFSFLNWFSTGNREANVFYDIVAILSFSAPQPIGVTGTGSGSAQVAAHGRISDGILTWTSVTSTVSELLTGHPVSFAFLGGTDLFNSHDEDDDDEDEDEDRRGSLRDTELFHRNSTGAEITLGNAPIKEPPPPVSTVPLPAGGLLLVGALGALTAMRRRARA